MLNKSAQAGKAPLSDRRDDLYETPECAVRALLAAETLPHGWIWEPACGPGAIVRALKAAGHKAVWATDLVDYHSPDQNLAGVDFLMEHAANNIVAIVTNPPYKLADKFVAHALMLCPRVYMLLRLAFLESQRRSSILDGGQLAKVYVFSRRLPMMHRAGWGGPRAGSATAFAWFVWDRAHTGPTELHRISWR